MAYLNATYSCVNRWMSTVTYIATYLSWSAVTVVFWTSGVTGQHRRDEEPMPPPPPWYDVTTQPDAEPADKKSWHDELPWWWWIAVVAGSSVAAVLLMSLCACLCCRRRRRRRKMAQDPEGAKKDSSSSSHGISLRRLDSTTAKRYLHNIVSVFSWGSDFDAAHDESRRVTPTPSPRSSQRPLAAGHVYVNPDVLGIEDRDVSGEHAAPPRPPRKNEVNHYLNVSFPHRRQLSHET